jgi:transcriptional regulator with XRE-family HTH domain
MDCRKIGELIQSLRKEHKLTQQALAEKINVGD